MKILSAKEFRKRNVNEEKWWEKKFKLQRKSWIILKAYSDLMKWIRWNNNFYKMKFKKLLYASKQNNLMDKYFSLRNTNLTLDELSPDVYKTLIEI